MQFDWNALMEQASGLIGGYVPNLLGALAVLVIGWVVALIAGAIVRGALRRTTVDDRIAAWITGSDTEVDVSRGAGKMVTWTILLFVLVAFFQALQLTVVTEPLSALLTKITEFAPRVLGAAVLLAVAWIMATVVRKVVNTALTAADLDSRVGGSAGAEGDDDLPLSRTISEAVYWLIFLLFLPAALGALGVEGLLAPVQSLTAELLGFLPNLLGAGLIFAIGWFVARLVQRIVTNLLSAAGADRLSERVGLASALGERRLSGLLGTVVYVFILLPVLVSALNALQLEAITGPASSMIGQVLETLPRLFGAGLLLTLAWFISRIVAELVGNLLAAAGFDRIPGALGLRYEGEHRLSNVASSVIVVAVMLFAAVEAAGLLGFAELADLVAGFIVFGGQVLLGLVILGVGLYLARLADETLSAGGSANSRVLGVAARISILVLAAAMGLRQMGLANEIINLAFGLLLGAVAVAAALAFGLGARDSASELVREWVADLKKAR